MVLALALAGAGILASRDALPGDGLYTVKRVSESAGLALTFDEMSRAQRHLDLASTRLGEVEQLVATDPKVTTEDPELVTSAIQEFDDSTGEGARILLTDEDAGNAEARDDLRSWAAEQSARLTELQPALPAGAETEDALALLSRVVGRIRGAAGPDGLQPPRPRRSTTWARCPAASRPGTTRSQDASGATTAGAARRPDGHGPGDDRRRRPDGLEGRTRHRFRPRLEHQPAGSRPTATSRAVCSTRSRTRWTACSADRRTTRRRAPAGHRGVRTTTADRPTRAATAAATSR